MLMNPNLISNPSNALVERLHLKHQHQLFIINIIITYNTRLYLLNKKRSYFTCLIFTNIIIYD